MESANESQNVIGIQISQIYVISFIIVYKARYLLQNLLFDILIPSKCIGSIFLKKNWRSEIYQILLRK
jgi:hypothetical protein